MPGIGFVKVEGYEDQPLSLKVVQAVVVVGTDPRKTIIFRVGGPCELRDGRHLRIVEIGPYRLSATDPDGSWPDFLDLGRAGPFSDLLSPPVRDVDDLVKRYDEVMAQIALLSANGSFRAADGRVYQFHRQ